MNVSSICPRSYSWKSASGQSNVLCECILRAKLLTKNLNSSNFWLWTNLGTNGYCSFNSFIIIRQLFINIFIEIETIFFKKYFSIIWLSISRWRPSSKKFKIFLFKFSISGTFVCESQLHISVYIRCLELF